MRSRESTLSESEVSLLCNAASTCFTVKACSGNVAVVVPKPGWVECFDRMISELEERGFQAKLVERAGSLFLVFFRIRRGWRPYTYLLAFLVTLVTVLIAGFDVARAFATIANRGNLPLLAFTFLAGLLGPLVAHESGHLAAARRGRIPVSPPLFLPAPPPSLGGIGTFGALINMRGLARDRESLALLGLMGPLTGFLAALPLAWIGLRVSLLLPARALGNAASVGFAPLVMLLLASAVGGSSGYAIVLHPLALASFIVFVVTFLNLLPIGQLDGAHVVYAIFGERVHAVAGYATLVISMLAAILAPSLSVVAVFSLLAYIINAVLARGRHPGVLNPYKPMPAWKAGLVAAGYFLLLVLTVPVPVG